MSSFLLYSESNIVDLINLFRYINNFTAKLGIKAVSIDESKCLGILSGMKQDFPYTGGANLASPFKKVANFVAYFIAEAPISVSFPKEIIGEELHKINNHQNVIVALAIAIDALHNAVIYRSDKECKLVNKIQLSKHSLMDIVDAISRVTPQYHFKVLSVLFEQLAYKTNPDCQYSDFIEW